MMSGAFCPKCEYPLEVEEFAFSYAITDNGHTVDSCPNCLIGLLYIDGRLVENKPVLFVGDEHES